MPPPVDSVLTLIDRPHWTVVGERATFAPVPTGWRAIVNRLQEPTGNARYHVAVVDGTGATRYAREASSLAEAVKCAERDIAARNALRLARRR